MNKFYEKGFRFEKVQRGSTGPAVVQLQEALVLNGLPLAIDGVFGPVTEEMVRRFRNRYGLSEEASLTLTDWAFLYRNLIWDIPTFIPFRDSVLFVATRFLELGAREIPRNRGPWVRLFVGRLAPCPWCVGFVIHVYAEVCNAVKKPVEFPYTLSTSVLVKAAEKMNRIVSVPRRGDFVAFRNNKGYYHTGLVVRGNSELVETIEGNVENEGIGGIVRKVRNRKSSLYKMDFISIEGGRSESDYGAGSSVG